MENSGSTTLKFQRTGIIKDRNGPRVRRHESFFAINFDGIFLRRSCPYEFHFHEEKKLNILVGVWELARHMEETGSLVVRQKFNYLRRVCPQVDVPYTALLACIYVENIFMIPRERVHIRYV